MFYPKNNQLAGMTANRIDINGPNTHLKVWHLPNWKKGNDVQRIAVLRKIASESGRDPRFATLAVSILKAHNIPPRDYKAQANALLKWVQHNIYYVNEPSERLQDPMYTLKIGYGDCDDMAILLGTLYESIRLDWRFVLSGKVNGKLTRWIEGTPLPRHCLKMAVGRISTF
jgi:transglutaminase-like putative cysteine protease